LANSKARQPLDQVAALVPRSSVLESAWIVGNSLPWGL